MHFKFCQHESKLTISPGSKWDTSYWRHSQRKEKNVGCSLFHLTFPSLILERGKTNDGTHELWARPFVSNGRNVPRLQASRRTFSSCFGLRFHRVGRVSTISAQTGSPQPGSQWMFDWLRSTQKQFLLGCWRANNGVRCVNLRMKCRSKSWQEYREIWD